MLPRVGAAPPTLPATPATPALQDRYDAYRLRQGRALLELVPRDGLRNLVTRARHASRLAVGPDVSLDELAAFCADLLPLPPLGLWMTDFRHNREAHLSADPPGETGPRGPDGAPVVVAVRHFRHGGSDWVGQLLVWHRDDRWEGAIQFLAGSDAGSWRTAPIFRASTAGEVRERFDSFDDGTLSAFLRSSLP